MKIIQTETSSNDDTEFYYVEYFNLNFDNNHPKFETYLTALISELEFQKIDMNDKSTIQTSLAKTLIKQNKHTTISDDKIKLAARYIYSVSKASTIIDEIKASLTKNEFTLAFKNLFNICKNVSDAFSSKTETSDLLPILITAFTRKDTSGEINCMVNHLVGTDFMKNNLLLSGYGFFNSTGQFSLMTLQSVCSYIKSETKLTKPLDSETESKYKKASLTLALEEMITRIKNENPEHLIKTLFKIANEIPFYNHYFSIDFSEDFLTQLDILLSDSSATFGNLAETINFAMQRAMHDSEQNISFSSQVKETDNQYEKDCKERLNELTRNVESTLDLDNVILPINNTQNRYCFLAHGDALIKIKIFIQNIIEYLNSSNLICNLSLTLCEQLSTLIESSESKAASVEDNALSDKLKSALLLSIHCIEDIFKITHPQTEPMNTPNS